MKIAVVGGTGTVGGHVIRELLARGCTVRALTRGEPGRRTLPARVEAVIGNLLEPGTVSTFFRGVDGAFLLNAVSPTEAYEGLMALNGICEAEVQRLVYLSVQAPERAPHLPHYGSKLGIEAAIFASGVAHTVLRPNNFFQNDYWAKGALLTQGRYTQPIGGAGLSRIDVRDIAEAAAIALTTKRPTSECFDLAGPDVLTGTRTAEIWGEALGREVTYAGDDLVAWQREQGAYLTDWMAFDLVRMYAYFQRAGLPASQEALERLSALLGHAPRSFTSFARETAASWSS